MSIHLSAVKKGLFTLSREFIAGKSTFISFSRHFIVLKTVVIPYEDGRHSNEHGRNGDDDRPHGNKLLKFSLNIWSAARLRFATGDSPGVKVYHFASVPWFPAIKLYAFRNGLGISLRLLSAGKVKTVKQVNSKWVNFSDKIEKYP